MVEDLFLKALNTEKFNKPSSGWIKKFAQTSNEVFQRSIDTLADAEIREGRLVRIKEGKLILTHQYYVDPEYIGIEDYPGQYASVEELSLPVAFEITT